MEKFRENSVLFITIIATIVISIVGLIVLVSTDKPPITQEEKQSLLVKSDSHIIGNPDAAITLVEFSDFECPACKSVYEGLDESDKGVKGIKEDYKDDIKFVYRHYPLRSIHPLAQIAAEASEAAGAQGKFWEYHDILFEKQNLWSFLDKNGAKLQFVEYAREVGVEDIAQFETELNSGTYSTKVQADVNDGQDLNINATPTLYLNGEKISSPSYAEISRQIEELKSAQ